MQKISLVFPRLKYQTGDPPLGMALLAANLRNNGFEVSLVDSTFHQSMDWIQNKIKEFNPDAVAVYSDSMMFDESTSVMKFARSLGKKVIAGGPHATLEPQSLDPFADWILKGEADELLVEIMQGKHNDQKIIEGGKPNIENLPIAAYDLLELDKYTKLWHLLDSVDPSLKGTSIFSSRGCPYRCTFCQPVLDKIFGKGVRTRSVDSVIKEIKYLIKDFGIQAVFFQDDTFTVRRKWIFEFCEKLKEEKIDILWGINSRIDLLDEEITQKMYDSGLRVMHIGVETGSQRVADEIYHKDIQLSQVPPKVKMAEKIGVHCLCFFMLGAPGETKEEINETIKFARSLNATEITATLSTPLPGTHMYDDVKGKYGNHNKFFRFRLLQK